MSHRSPKIVRMLALGAACAALLAACSSSSAAPSPPASVGSTIHRTIPAAVRDAPLVDQHGTTVDLSSWSGKTVLLVPFLTLCTDICPMTTGDLLQVQQALRADGSASDVEIVELSVDPRRDTPARLAAYAKLTGAHWNLVTESPAALATISTFFGFEHEKVAEDDPPDIDWWTGKPLTYDVDHSDGFVIIDPKGTERYFSGAAPSFHGHLVPTLQKFLSPLGHKNLRHPATPSYTTADILQALGWSMHRPLASQGD